MAKYIEVIAGAHKGLQCFVRSAFKDADFYETFSGLKLKKADCKEIEYENNWKPERDRGCRGER